MSEAAGSYSDSSGDQEKLNKNMNLFTILLKSNVEEKDKINQLQEALQQGADINFQDANRNSNTLLHVAVKKGYLEVISYLLKEKSVNVDLKNNKGKTAKDLAAEKPEILAILEEFSQQCSHMVSPNQGELSISMPLSHQPSLKQEELQPNQRSEIVKKRPPLDAIERDGDIDSKKRKIAHLPDGPYQASGVKSTLHGVVYQLKLLMLFAWKAKEKGYSFRLATEMNAAEKFDDVVFQYVKLEIDKVSSRFLQAKHIQVDNEKRVKITGQDLLTESDGKFSLQKYFISYLKIKRNAVFSGLQDFVICTNIDFDFDIKFNQPNLKKLSHNKPLYFEMVSEEDDILNLEGGERYRFVSKNIDEDKRTEVVSELKELFEKNSESKKLAETLAYHLLKGEAIGLNNEFFKSYQVPLVRYVIDRGSQRLSKDFLNGNQKRPDVKTFRKEFREAVKQHLEELKELKEKDPEKLTERDKDILEKKLDFESPSKKFKTEISDEASDSFFRKISSLPLKISDGFKETLVLDENPKLNNPEEYSKEMGYLINKQKSNNKLIIQRNNILYSEIYKLAGHVLVEINCDSKKVVVFSDKFLNGDLLKGNLQDFRTKLMSELKVKNFDGFRTKLTDYTFKITGFQTCRESEFDTQLQSQSEIIFPDSQISEEEVEEFMDKLVFAVNQPNEERLIQLMSKELGEEFNLIDAELITDNFQHKMLTWMKERQGENRYLSEIHIASFFKEAREKISQIVLIGLTSEYTKRIDETGMKFKPESFPDELKNLLKKGLSPNVSNFVCQEGETLLGSIKVRQIIGDIQKYKKDGSYIFIRLSSLSRLAKAGIEAFKKADTDLLIVECKIHEKSIDNSLYENLLSMLNEYAHKKVLLISSNNNQWVEKFKETNKIEDKASFNDLTEESQKKLLKSKISFQENEISLNQIVFKENTELTQLLPLADLMKGKKIEIGKPIPISYGYDPDFYIHRTFNQEVAIKEDIFNDSKDLVAKDKKEFEKVCRQHPNRNVHWLQNESGQWLWKKSQGSLTNLREYIGIGKTEDVQTFLQNTENHQVILIADTAGMGKTTVLTHLSKVIKKDKPNHWVIRIDLNDHTTALNDQQEKTFTTDNMVEFIGEKLLKLENPLEKALFSQSFQPEKAAPLVLMFDGFDEISPSYKETVIDLLTTLKSTAIKQLWVTTRPHLKYSLEDELQQLAYTLEPFSEANQIDFLLRFWKKKLELSENTERLQDYAQQLVRKLACSIGDVDNEFTGIPLQTRMLAESFQTEIKDHLKIEKDILELPDRLQLIDLYEKFIEHKYDIFQSEKLKKDLNNPGVQEEQHSIFENFKKTHQKLAIKSILGEEKYKDILPGETNVNISEEKISRGGLVQITDGEPHFVHSTFAEYYLADFIVEKLKNEQQPSEKFQDFILNHILLTIDYPGIRSFINGFLEKNIFSQDRTIKRLWNECENNQIIENAAISILEGNSYITDFLLSGSKENFQSVIKQLLDTYFKDILGQWEKQIDPSQIFEILFKWGEKGGLTMEYMILTMGSGNLNAWNLALHMCNIPILKKLFEWIKETNIDIKDILEKEDPLNRTPYFIAAYRNSPEVLNKLLEWGKESGIDKKTILSKKNGCGNTIWLEAATNKSIEVMDLLLKWGEDVGITKKDMLLSKDSFGRSALLLSVNGADIRMLEQVLSWGKDAGIKKDILLDCNILGKTALPYAMNQRQFQMAGTLLQYGANINDLDAGQCILLRMYIIKDPCFEKIDTLLAMIEQRLSVFMMELAARVGLDAMDVEVAGPSCSSRHRRVILYEPLQESNWGKKRQASHWYNQLVLAVVRQSGESADKWLRYQRYLGNILEKEVENRCSWECVWLEFHYEEAERFFEEHPKSTVLKDVAADFAPAVGESVWLQNRHEMWWVLNTGERYELYSPDFNYRQRFQTRLGVSWSELSECMKTIFAWWGSGEYHHLVLQSPFPESALAQLSTSLVWQSDKMAPDRVLLAERHSDLIEGIPAAAIRELFFVQGQIVDWMALHADFFKTPGIQLRLDKLLQVMPELNDEQRRSLKNVVMNNRLMAEQLIFKATSFRKENRPYTSFWEALTDLTIFSLPKSAWH